MQLFNKLTAGVGTAGDESYSGDTYMVGDVNPNLEDILLSPSSPSLANKPKTSEGVQQPRKAATGPSDGTE